MKVTLTCTFTNDGHGYRYPDELKPGETMILWAFTSTTSKISVLKSSAFLGSSGPRKRASTVPAVVVIVGFYYALPLDQRRFSKHDGVSNGAAALFPRTIHTFVLFNVSHNYCESELSHSTMSLSGGPSLSFEGLTD